MKKTFLSFIVSLSNHRDVKHATQIIRIIDSKALQNDSNYHECLTRTWSIGQDASSRIVTQKIANKKFESFDKKTLPKKY